MIPDWCGCPPSPPQHTKVRELYFAFPYFWATFWNWWIISIEANYYQLPKKGVKAVFESYDTMICAMCCSIYWLCMLLLFDFRTLLMVWYFLDCQLLMLITYFTGVDCSSQILIIMILICGICHLYIIWPDMYDILPLFVVLCFKTRTSLKTDFRILHHQAMSYELMN